MRFGDPELPRRVWNKILPRRGGCWEWMGARTPQGYGVTSFKKKLQTAHRALYEAESGRVPAGKELDHLCRNRWCCNPKHMEAVTRRENANRGLRPLQMRGSSHFNAKLNESQIVEIRSFSSSLSHSEIAKIYGVTSSSIGLIRRGVSWKHVVQPAVIQEGR